MKGQSKSCITARFVKGSTTLSLNVNGFTRTVIVHVPKSSNGTTPLALVLNLHGSGSTALEQEGFTKMNATANEYDFIVAYPQALIPDGTGFDWNVPGEPLVGGRAVPPKSANDVKFLTSLVGIMESKYCVKTTGVYATGFSGDLFSRFGRSDRSLQREWTELLDLFGRNRGQGLVEPRSLPLNRAFGAGERRQVDDVLHVFERSGDRALRDLR